MKKPTVSATYRAIAGSSIKIDNQKLSIEVHKMIVWAMHNDEASMLIPEYLRIRGDVEAQKEGSAKNFGIEP